jgi:hypothetical protein
MDAAQDPHPFNRYQAYGLICLTFAAVLGFAAMLIIWAWMVRH